MITADVFCNVAPGKCCMDNSYADEVLEERGRDHSAYNIDPDVPAPTEFYNSVRCTGCGLTIKLPFSISSNKNKHFCNTCTRLVEQNTCVSCLKSEPNQRLYGGRCVACSEGDLPF